MERALPLPFCCKCKASISSRTLVGFACAHLFCEQCEPGLSSCQICGLAKGIIDRLPSLIKSYDQFKTSQSDDNYAKLFEEINVNDVLCLYGSSCTAKDKCRFDHNMIGEEEDALKCPVCGANTDKSQRYCLLCDSRLGEPEQKPQVEEAKREIIPKEQNDEAPQEGCCAKLLSSIKHGFLCCFCSERENSSEAKPLVKKGEKVQ